MKKILFGMLVLGAMASCKKDKKDNNCESTVAGIAGGYKITKLIISASGIPDQDVTGSQLSDCEKNGVYALKADKTFTYTESGTTCTETASGTWDIVSDKITINTTSGGGFNVNDFSATPLTSWDCTTFVVSESIGSGITYKYYFTKQ